MTPTHGQTALSVNVNKVALLRNSRHLDIPSVTRAAQACLQAGAQGITVHPRPDARHVRPADVGDIAHLLQDWPGREFNIEGNPFQNLMDHVRRHRPHQCTFVPDAEDQFTSDHGWRFPQDLARLRPLVQEARSLGVRVSLFMDADASTIAMARDAGADRVELYTEPYAAAVAEAEANGAAGGTALQDAAVQAQIVRFAAAAQAAQAVGLGVNAGHDLNLKNLPAFVRAVPSVLEVSIGHAFIADALEQGYAATTQAYLAALRAS